MTDEFEQIADGLRDDATFLSGWLPTEPDGRDILRDKLDLDPADLHRLLLCRPPAPSNYWKDVQKIGEFVGAEPAMLASGLREAAALGAIRQALRGRHGAAERDEAAGVVQAARDAAAETVVPFPTRGRLEELAERFWSDAGQASGARDLQQATSIALPVAVTHLPRLSLSAVSGWLHRYGINYDLAQPDRPLRGLLIAARGLGMVFIDGSLPEQDRRFTLAHELGHFILDYLEPRRRVLEEMPELADVIDGERDPSPAERARATLQRVPIGTHTHLLERDPHGGATEEVEGVEEDATQLAMELLAPWDEAMRVVAQATQDIRDFDETLGAATNALATAFDMPNDVARARAKACLEESGRHRGFFDR